MTDIKIWIYPEKAAVAARAACSVQQRNAAPGETYTVFQIGEDPRVPARYHGKDYALMRERAHGMGRYEIYAAGQWL